ncbi:MAG: alanine racemase [Eubacterium sp.]|nr:alanine racemase [Eubacterium sp.]
MKEYQRCYALVSLKAIRHNIEEARKRILPGTKLLAVVKANAYGHGAVPVAKSLEECVDFFAVATLAEGEELRNAGIEKPILVLAYVSPSQYEKMVSLDIRPSIYDLHAAELLEQAASAMNKRAKIHIAVDTGMTRIGFQITEEDADTVAAISRMPHIETEGIFSHLSCCDMTDKTFCMGQFDAFRKMLEMLSARNVQIPIRHICNSAAIGEFEADDPNRYDMVRSGITTYGIYPSEEVDKSAMNLLPALEWKAHVIHVKEVGPGRGVSYGATYVTDKPLTRIATVSAGYADGYPRALSSKGRVLIRGQYAPIIGRVCMDQMMVDVTDIPDVQVEDVVTLVGHDGNGFIPIEEVADPSASFNYEMLCRIAPRVTRIYEEE